MQRFDNKWSEKNDAQRITLMLKRKASLGGSRGYSVADQVKRNIEFVERDGYCYSEPHFIY